MMPKAVPNSAAPHKMAGTQIMDPTLPFTLLTFSSSDDPNLVRALHYKSRLDIDSFDYRRDRKSKSNHQYRVLLLCPGQ